MGVVMAWTEFVIGISLGVIIHYLSMWRWRRMYDRGEAECWRCHGSGKERNQ